MDEMAYVETLFGHQDRITGVDAGIRERAVTSGGRDGTVRLWKIIEESQLVFNGKALSKLLAQSTCPSKLSALTDFACPRNCR